MCAGFHTHLPDLLTRTSQWEGPLPHKKVCKRIRALADAAGFPIYTNPKTLPPQIEVDEFYRRVQDAVSLSAVNAFNENMIEDDRIRRVVNDSTFPFNLWLFY
jgi:hypothetical protein